MKHCWKQCSASELETVLNKKLVKRAKLNEELVEICRVIDEKGLTLIPEQREFTGKYFLVVKKEEK